jgi:hypothetical protein
VLKVAKWENSFDAPIPPLTDPTLVLDWINVDVDSFYIKVKDISKKGEGHIHVGVCTMENEDSDYDDPETKVVLIEILDGNGDPTGEFHNKYHRFILVSDAVDNGNIPVGGRPNINNQDNNGSDPADNDRTHLIQLGGKFVVKYIPDSNTPSEFHTRSAFVARKKTVTVNVFILKNSAGMEIISEKEVNDYWKIVRERYAQVGVWINWEVYPPVAQPAGVNLDDGLRVEAPSIVGGPSNKLDPEAMALINGIGVPNKVNAYYVNKIQPPNPLIVGPPPAKKTVTLGLAVTKEYFPSHDDYYYNFFIAVDKTDEEGNVVPAAEGFVEAHELGHCVGELLHPTEYFLLMGTPTSGSNTPTSTKRFSESEEAKIHADPHAK